MAAFEKTWNEDADPADCWTVPLTEEEQKLAVRLWAQIRYASTAAKDGIETDLFVTRTTEGWRIRAAEASAMTGTFTMEGEGATFEEALKNMEESS